MSLNTQLTPAAIEAMNKAARAVVVERPSYRQPIINHIRREFESRDVFGKFIRRRRLMVGWNIVQAADITGKVLTAGQWGAIEHGKSAKVLQGDVCGALGKVLGLHIYTTQGTHFHAAVTEQGLMPEVFRALDNYLAIECGETPVGIMMTAEEMETRAKMRLEYLERMIVRAYVRRF